MGQSITSRRTWLNISALHLIVLLSVTAMEIQLRAYNAERIQTEYGYEFAYEGSGTLLTEWGMILLAAPLSYFSLPLNGWIEHVWSPGALPVAVLTFLVTATFVAANSLLWDSVIIWVRSKVLHRYQAA